jgi:hypothetical protein
MKVQAVSIMAQVKLPVNALLCTTEFEVRNNGRRYQICNDEMKLSETIFGGDSTEDSIIVDKKELFNWLQKTYGRCISKVYIDDGTSIGWMFQARVKYDDCKDTFIKETWISIVEKIVTPPVYNSVGL